jgi:anaphase-promoting complex subunit 2
MSTKFDSLVSCLNAFERGDDAIDASQLNATERHVLSSHIVHSAVTVVRVAHSDDLPLLELLARVLPPVHRAFAALSQLDDATAVRSLSAQIAACAVTGLSPVSALGSQLLDAFRRHFGAFDRARRSSERIAIIDADDDDDQPQADDEPFDAAAYGQLCASLHVLGLVAACEDLITQMLFAEISLRIERSADTDYATPLLDSLRRWLVVSPKRWLELTLGDSAAAAHWLARLDGLAIRSVASARCASLMNIVREYPESMGALDDLRTCVEITGEFERVVAALNAQYVMRLLHPGAYTNDIIVQFVSTIKALRYVEPAGVMLEQVLEPIRAYLRGRDDTVRCMLQAFTDESSDLYEEFMHGDASATIVALCDDDLVSGEVNDERRAAYRAWQPDPIHAHASTSRVSRLVDTISLLVGVFGAPARFVKEYRNVLGERLLSLASFNVDNELTQAEMFKLRFGDASMQECGIMLKDIGDSKRVNAHVASEIDVSPLTIVLCSYLSWPTLKESKLILPPWLTQRIDAFAARFRLHKAQRDMFVAPQHGAVELELDVGADEPLAVTCSPLQATVALCFAKTVQIESAAVVQSATDDELDAVQRGLSPDAIAQRVGASVEEVRGALQFWASKRVLKFSATDALWQLVQGGDADGRAATQEDGGAVNGRAGGNDDDDDDDGDDDDDDDDDEGDELAGDDGAGDGGGESDVMAEAQPFILAMLTNLGALPAMRINMMLSNFVGGYSASVDELTRYLSQLVTEGVLEVNAGAFALSKKR